MNLKSILRQLDKTEERIIFVLMVASLVILFVQVVLRYTLSYSFTWAEELVRIFFVWVTLMGISLACKYSMHICIDVTQLFLPKSLIRYIDIVAAIITIFLGGLLAYLIFRIVGRQIEHPQYFATMPWFPVWGMYLAGVLGMLGLAIRTAVHGLLPLIRSTGRHGSTDEDGHNKEAEEN